MVNRTDLYPIRMKYGFSFKEAFGGIILWGYGIVAFMPSYETKKKNRKWKFFGTYEDTGE